MENPRKCCPVFRSIAPPRVTRHRMPAAKTQTQQVAAPLVGEERPLALSEGRLSLSLPRRERQIKAFESKRCILHKGRNHSHEDFVADQGFHSWHPSNLVHTRVPSSNATKTPPLKIAREGRLERHLIAKRLGHITHHGRFLLSSTKGTLSNICWRKKSGWTKSQRSSHAAHRPSAFGMHSTRTEKHLHFNFQEQILGYERNFIICPLEDRNRTFVELVSKKSALQFACEVDC